ncbi:MAG: 3-keto-disaccharide hydrolase [Bacillota bacterium]
MSNAKWKHLFDGKTLKGWGITGNEEGWTVDDGAIKCKAQNGGYLYTYEKFEDFVLSVDFKLKEGTNSGIFIRWSDLDNPVHTGIEVQILDCFGDEEITNHSCGGLYDMVAPSEIACNPPGKWNNMKIKAEGSDIIVEHNGVRIVEVNINEWDEPGKNPDGSENKFANAWKDMPREGHIGLQDHNGIIWFREVKIMPL